MLVEWAPFYHPLHPNADARRHQPEREVYVYE